MPIPVIFNACKGQFDLISPIPASLLLMHRCGTGAVITAPVPHLFWEKDEPGIPKKSCSKAGKPTAPGQICVNPTNQRHLRSIH